MILKMDIEGAEWDVLPDLSDDILNRFRQIVFEFHGMTRISPFFKKKVHASLKNLNKTHQLVHVHANNCGMHVKINDDVKFPFFLETTYVRKNDYIFIDNERKFPTCHDYVNIENIPEIELGKWH